MIVLRGLGLDTDVLGSPALWGLGRESVAQAVITIDGQVYLFMEPQNRVLYLPFQDRSTYFFLEPRTIWLPEVSRVIYVSEVDRVIQLMLEERIGFLEAMLRVIYDHG